jgi:hypothetical protein
MTESNAIFRTGTIDGFAGDSRCSASRLPGEREFEDGHAAVLLL